MSFSRQKPIRQKGSQKSYGAVEAPRSRDSSPSPASRSATDRRGNTDDPLPKLKHQVDEVKGILKDNIEKVVERDHKVGVLIDRTDNLRATSTQFKKSATTLRKETQRRNWKLIGCLICVIVVILAIVTLVVLYALKVL